VRVHGPALHRTSIGHCARIMASEESERRGRRSRKLTKKEKTCRACGAVGHLSKECPHRASSSAAHAHEDPPHLTTPPRRIQFRTKADRSAFVQRVRAFKHQSSKHRRFQRELYTPILTEVLAYLVYRHGKRKDLLPPSEGIVLAFTNSGEQAAGGAFTLADSCSETGHITLSRRALEMPVDDRDGWELPVEYECERKWMNGWCQSKEDHLFWLLLHEFAHLFEGCNHDLHDDEFFSHVDELARDAPFLFASPLDDEAAASPDARPSEGAKGGGGGSRGGGSRCAAARQREQWRRREHSTSGL